MKAKNMLFGLMLAMVLVFPVAFAEEATEDATTPELITEPTEDVEDVTLPEPGITPDNPLYGLDRAMERIDLALTFNKADKAKKGLIHARERLAEVKAMVETKKIDAAEIAQEAHDDELAEVEDEIADLSEENATEEMEDVVELEEEVNIHRMYVEKVGDSLIKIKGSLTAEQQAMVDDLLASIGNSTIKLKIEVQNKGESSKVKIKLQTGKSDVEIEGIVTNLSEKYQLENAGKSGVIKTKMVTKVKSEVGSQETETEIEEETEVEDESEDVEDTEESDSVDDDSEDDSETDVTSDSHGKK